MTGHEMFLNLSIAHLACFSHLPSAFLSIPISTGSRFLTIFAARTTHHFSPFLLSSHACMHSHILNARFFHFLETPLLFQAGGAAFTTAIQGQIYDSDLEISIENVFFKGCVGAQSPGGAVSVGAQGAKLEIRRCDFLACVQQVSTGGALAVKKAVSATLTQCCFVKCSALAGTHAFAIEAANAATIDLTQNFVGENGNQNSPTTFSMISGNQAFENSNVSFNAAIAAVGANIVSPEKANIEFVLFVGNRNGDLLSRAVWAQKSETLSFLNIIDNTLTAVFTGELFATVKAMLVIRNSLNAFVKVSDHCILAITDSGFDYEEASSVLRNRGSHSAVRFEHCRFGIQSLPKKANAFSWSEVCFMVSDAQFPLTPGQPIDQFFALIGDTLANPHVFGLLMIAAALSVVGAFALYRRTVARAYGYERPAGFVRAKEFGEAEFARQ
jgi:hypothetical protein